MTSPYDSPLWLEALPADIPVTYGARLDRVLLDSLVTVPGITHPGDWLVTQRAAGANFTVDIAPGAGFVAGTSIASQGKYMCRTTAVVNVPVTSAPASGTRTDLIVAKVLDPQSDGQSTYGWAFVAVPGPDNAGTVPTVPANSYLVAQISVATGLASITNAVITDRRLSAAAMSAPAASRRRGTGSTFNLAGGPNTQNAVTAWGADMFNVGNISYANGIFTVRDPGIYEWNATIQWPAGSGYRIFQYVLINGSADAAGEQSRTVDASSSLVSSGFAVQLAAGGTVQMAVQASTGGVTGVLAAAFSLTRVA